MRLDCVDDALFHLHWKWIDLTLSIIFSYDGSWSVNLLAEYQGIFSSSHVLSFLSLIVSNDSSPCKSFFWEVSVFTRTKNMPYYGAPTWMLDSGNNDTCSLAEDLVDDDERSSFWILELEPRDLRIDRRCSWSYGRNQYPRKFFTFWKMTYRFSRSFQLLLFFLTCGFFVLSNLFSVFPIIYMPAFMLQNP